LGPNGAGKSTSVKMLLGLVAPSGGSAQVLGYPPGHTAMMARVGFLPEHFRYHEWLQAAELLDLHGRLYGMDAAARRRRVPELLELVGLQDHARRPIGGFSKGMLQRIGLAQALLNEPAVVFLDEPTSALDPFGRMLVRGIIRDLKARGTTVFLNSHLLGEVEATCDRVSFIKEGRVLRTEVLSEFQAGNLHAELRVDAVTPALLAALDDLVPEWRLLDGAVPELQPAERDPAGPAVATVPVETATTLELVLSDEELLPVIAQRTLATGARLYALTPRRVSLEQLFLEIVGREDSGQ
ncbi:MAG TPA: ABC transporter ATP-binding protein, partial [Herpetosiphonaceae bacterium]|nr:ABC transporter ATP-binding protein [Herpetosiphonaceae bacterium]